MFPDNFILHSFNDQPAVNTKDSLVWYKHGFRSREDGKPSELIIDADTLRKRYLKDGMIIKNDSWQSLNYLGIKDFDVRTMKMP